MLSPSQNAIEVTADFAAFRVCFGLKFRAASLPECKETYPITSVANSIANITGISFALDDFRGLQGFGSAPSSHREHQDHDLHASNLTTLDGDVK